MQANRALKIQPVRLSLLGMLALLLMLPVSLTFAQPASNAACTGDFTPIYEIQGSGTQAAIVGRVTTEGIVTGDFQTGDSDPAGELDGFYLQDPDGDNTSSTSDGIFVFTGGNNLLDVIPGQRVRVTGLAQDALGQTQINAFEIIDCETSGTITPVQVTLPISDVDLWEQYEGMLITLSAEEGDLTVSEHYNLARFGEVLVSSGGRLYQFTHLNTPDQTGFANYQQEIARRSLIVDDANRATNLAVPPYMNPPAPGEIFRTGYTTTSITGVLGFGFGQYRLQPTQPIEWDADSNPRTDMPPVVDGQLRAASFNVLNYFNGNGTGGGFPTSRGADSRAEFTRQRDKILSALLALDADVVGLMEIENDTGTNAAIIDLVNGLNDVAGEGTYAYIDTGRLGTDEIRVALIYKPATVTPVGDFMTDSSSVFSRPPLAQTFEENATGERFTVIVNHFKSKSSSGATGADQDQNDGQGAFNARRVQQAQRLLVFIDQTVIPTSGDPDVLIMGDLNAYALEDPIATLESGGYTNLIAEFVGTDAYSYIFEGQSGYLDHALSSASLTPQVAGAGEWHINADEPIVRDYNTERNPAYLYVPDAFRSADHDPVVVGLNLGVSLTPTVETTVEATLEATEETTPEMTEIAATDETPESTVIAVQPTTIPETTEAPTDEPTPETTVVDATEETPTETVTEVPIAPTDEPTPETTPPAEDDTEQPPTQPSDQPSDTPLIIGLIIAILAVLSAALGLSRSRK